MACYRALVQHLLQSWLRGAGLLALLLLAIVPDVTYLGYDSPRPACRNKTAYMKGFSKYTKASPLRLAFAWV
jgi:hypothetical protein